MLKPSINGVKFLPGNSPLPSDLTFDAVAAHYGQGGKNISLSTSICHGGDNPTGLSIGRADDGVGIVGKCFTNACDHSQICDGLRRDMGLPAFEPKRTTPLPLPRKGNPIPSRPPDWTWLYRGPGGITGRMRRWDEPGGKVCAWERGVAGKARQLLYYAHAESADEAAHAILCEGGKTADAVAAACTSHRVIGTVSASTTPTASTLSLALTGCQSVTFWRDADAEGLKHQQATLAVVRKVLGDQVELLAVDVAGMPNVHGADAADLEPEARLARVVNAGLWSEPPAVKGAATAASAKAAGEAAAKALYPRRDLWAMGDALHALGYEVRRDIRAQAFQWRADGGTWQAFDDAEAALMRAKLARDFSYIRSDGNPGPLRFNGPEFWDNLGGWARERKGAEVDPFIEYLESRPTWDGVCRLDKLLSRALGVEPDALCLWSSRFVYMASIQRAYEPAAFIKESPVLIGAERLGKSPFLSRAFPPEFRPAWFTDALAYSDDPKQMLESTLGVVLCEFAELSAVRIRDKEHFKAFLARQVDNGVRLAYARTPVSIPRRFAIVFTSNEQNPLPNDAGGNSRFVPVYCTQGCDIDALLDAERDQLWSEALHRYRAGERANLPYALHGAQRRAVEGARATDSLESSVATLEVPPGGLTLEEIGRQLQMRTPLARPDQSRLIDALKAQGWARAARGADNARRWRRE